MSDALDVGAALKKARVHKGLSLETVQQKIRVQRKYLEAMESNRFADLPAPVYLRGFLKSYCDLLEIPSEPLWKAVHGHAAEDAPAVRRPAPPAPENGEAPARREPRRAAPRRAAEGEGGGRWAAPFALALAALVGGAALWSGRRAPSEAPAEPPPPREAPIAPLTPPKKASSLGLTFKERAWVRVLTDGRLRFEGWVPAGVSQSWEVLQALEVRTETPSAVLVLAGGAEEPLSSFPGATGGEFRVPAP